MKRPHQKPRKRKHHLLAKRQLEICVAGSARAMRFLAEQNRLLQRDNAALIKQLARLREELDAVKPKPEKKATSSKPAASAPVKRAPAKAAKAGKR